MIPPSLIGIILILVTLFIVTEPDPFPAPAVRSWLSAITVSQPSLIGIDMTKYKLLAFTVSAALAGTWQACCTPITCLP